MIELFVITGLLMTVSIGGVVFIRGSDQKLKDHQRQVYSLTFPADLDSSSVLKWLRSLSGMMHARGFRLTGTPTVVFEMWADEKGIRHLVRVPWQQDAEYLMNQLTGLVPGMTATRLTETPEHQWTFAVELGMRNSTGALSIESPEELAARLLLSVGEVLDNESILIQWVVTTARREAVQPTDREDVKRKLSEANVLAVARIAARAETPKRAEHLAYNVKKALSSVHSSRVSFQRRMVPETKVKERTALARAPMTFPIQLSLTELAALVAWPMGSPSVAGLPQSRTRYMQVMNNVPRVGRVIGSSNVPGRERDVAVDYTSALMHTHVIGPTSSGKTTLLANMIAQDMEVGHGVVLIETKQDLFHQALDRVPPHRMNDVIVWDLNDSTMPLGFNILDQSTSRSAVDELNALLGSIYQDNGIITPQVMYHGLHALAGVEGGSLVDLPTILTPQSQDEGAWREELIGNIRNPEIRKFWQRYLNGNQKEQDREAAPLHRRLWQFTTRPEVRNSLGQSKSTFKMTDVVADSKILLVNLNGVRIGEQTASILGTLIMNSLWSAARTEPHDRPVFLYMDEFQNFVKLPTSPADMLAQSRSFGLGMVLAHQHLGQLDHELRDAVLANARTKVVFQTTTNDARVMAGEFGRQVAAEDFLNLGRFEAIARIATQEGVSQPLTLLTKPPGKSTHVSRQVRELSRATYGRKVADVDAEIEARRQPKEKVRRRPPAADTWG